MKEKRHLDSLQWLQTAILDTRPRLGNVRAGETLGHTVNQWQIQDYNTGLLIRRPALSTKAQMSHLASLLQFYSIPVDQLSGFHIRFQSRISKITISAGWTIIAKLYTVLFVHTLRTIMGDNGDRIHVRLLCVFNHTTCYIVTQAQIISALIFGISIRISISEMASSQ